MGEAKRWQEERWPGCHACTNVASTPLITGITLSSG